MLEVMIMSKVYMDVGRKNKCSGVSGMKMKCCKRCKDRSVCVENVGRIVVSKSKEFEGYRRYCDEMFRVVKENEDKVVEYRRVDGDE
jgi:hypothetical protein